MVRLSSIDYLWWSCLPLITCDDIKSIKMWSTSGGGQLRRLYCTFKYEICNCCLVLYSKIVALGHNCADTVTSYKCFVGSNVTQGCYIIVESNVCNSLHIRDRHLSCHQRLLRCWGIICQKRLSCHQESLQYYFTFCQNSEPLFVQYYCVNICQINVYTLLYNLCVKYSCCCPLCLPKHPYNPIMNTILQAHLLIIL